MHRKSLDERIDFFLEAPRWIGTIVNTEPDKCDELRWAHLDQLPENVIPYVRCALAKYQQQPIGSVWFESYGWE